MKTTLTFEKISMPAAHLGGENPLPDLQIADLHSSMEVDDSVSPEEARYFEYGKVNGSLPYRKQDQYDREKEERSFEAVVLENDHLKAVFFPQFGGKLWSLYDKDGKRQLLHVNPVFQPANLAIRNAWTSGGVEWNFGMTGHSPMTLSPLHTAVWHRADGTPVLRMYEWERIREVSYQMDCFLPEDSRFLFVRVRLSNATDREVPVYWWSNIAVNETEDTRVLAPAAEAFCFDYTRKMSKREVPMYHGVDGSYTTRISRAMDLFFDIPASRRKWETALDGKGEGLIQTSTDRLQGRKLFLWGTNPGGRHWQEFLSQPGEAYLELQAGLAKTQMEHLPMPAGDRWEWLEAYGAMKADPSLVHGEDWKAACMSVEEQLEKALPRKQLEEELKRLDAETVSEKPIRNGSGWGALELQRKGLSDTFPGEAARFLPESMGEEQHPWLQLLEEGVFPETDPSEAPAAYLTQAEWIPLLLKAAEGGSDHWHSWLQLGVMYCAQGQRDKARDAFERSLQRKDNAWARRNLAVLDQLEGAASKAADELLEAAELLPDPSLALECGEALIEAGRWSDFIRFYDQLPEAVQKRGRLRALLARAKMEEGDLNKAQAILEEGLVISDIREGETLLSDLWIGLHALRIAKEENVPVDDALRERARKAFPVPRELDFRMTVEE